MSYVSLNLSYPKKCSRPEWAKAMQSVKDPWTGLVTLLDHVVMTKSDHTHFVVGGTRPDVYSWLDLLEASHPDVKMEVAAIKKEIHISFVQRRVDKFGQYSINLSELKRDFGTPDGIISKPWFWERE